MPKRRVTCFCHHIVKLVFLCAVILLSGCLESDEPITIRPSDVVQIKGLNVIWKLDPKEHLYQQLVLRKDGHYERSFIGVKGGNHESGTDYDLAFLPLSIRESGVEHFLGIAKHLDEKNPEKLEFIYLELRRINDQFSWRLHELVDDESLILAATAIARAKGISISRASSSFTMLQGSLNSSSLQALFSDPAFRKALKGEYKALEPISDTEKQELVAAGVDLASEATAERAGPGSTAANLLDELKKKVTSDGPFDQALFDRTAVALRAGDQQSPISQELLANVRDFVDGKVRASMFAAYLKETLPSITAASTRARESLKLLQDKSAEGDLWAKFFLARAHFHAAANAKEAQLRERFVGKGFPDTVRPYWDAYQTALRDPSFDGKFETAVTLAEEGAKKNFAPSVNVLGVMRLNGLGLPKDESHGLQLIRQAADAGFSMAMLGLANAYANGQGIPKDLTQAHSWWRKASDLGQADAMYALAFSFADGRGVPKNQAEAVGWLRKAAELGHPASMSSLGDFYAAGHGVAKDELVATQWYRKAAEAGETYAMVNLGWRYDNGRGVAKDEAQAVQWYRKAAEARDADAMVNLGVAYAKGRGVTKDEAQAVQWNRKAAELGHAGAMVNLGNLYAAGVGVAKDEAQATQWYRKAADGGNATAMFNLGNMYSSGRGITKDKAQAVQWYRKAAEAGYVDAMLNLGVAYDEGQGVTKDEAQAVQWYRKAAEAGQAGAMFNLGAAYSQGRGVTKDEAQSVQWYRKASELGHARAMYMLGLDYVIGKGVPKDDAQAVQWVRKAAQLGDNLAMAYLGTMYEEGLGVAKDNAQALEWYQKAAAAGNEQAAQSVQRLRDAKSKPAVAKSAEDWDARYRSARPISQAEFLQKVSKVRLEVWADSTMLHEMTLPNLKNIVRDTVIRQGMQIDDNSSIILRVKLAAHAFELTRTIGEVRDESHVAIITATVHFLLDTSLYRKGKFYKRTVIPAWRSLNGLHFAGRRKNRSVNEDVGPLIDQILSEIKKDSSMPSDNNWPAAVWASEQAGSMYSSYVESQQNGAGDVNKFAVGLQVVSLQHDIEGEASQILRKEFLSQAWENQLSRVNMSLVANGPVRLSTYVNLLKENVNVQQFNPLFGFISPGLWVGRAMIDISLMEDNVVYEVDGEFRRGIVALWHESKAVGSWRKDSEGTVLKMIDESIDRFVGDAQTRR